MKKYLADDYFRVKPLASAFDAYNAWSPNCSSLQAILNKQYALGNIMPWALQFHPYFLMSCGSKCIVTAEQGPPPLGFKTKWK